MKKYIIYLTFVLTIGFGSTAIHTQSNLTILEHNDFIGRTNFNPAGDSSPLVILHTEWGDIAMSNSGTNFNSVISSVLSDTEDVAIDNPLFYPSPFSIGDDVQLGFSLNIAANIELRIYDMRGNNVLRYDYGLQQYGYVKLNFDSSVYGSKDFPAGVYYYLILSDGDILGSGKFAIIP